MVTIIKKGTPREEIKKRIANAVYKSRKRDISKFAGKLKLELDPLDYQKQMRDEWK
jgi:hypothetical protein